MIKIVYGINVLDSRIQRVSVVGKSLFWECISGGKFTSPLTNVSYPYLSINDCNACEASSAVGYGSVSIHLTSSIGFCDMALMVGIVTAITIIVTNSILYGVITILILLGCL